MQVDGITNGISSSRYSQTNENTSNPMKVGIKEANVKPVKPAKEVEENKYTEDELINTIESANEQFVAYDRRFEFSIHDKTKQIMVKVIDVVTDETIREIPPEKILDMVAAIWEAAGLIVDERI